MRENNIIPKVVDISSTGALLETPLPSHGLLADFLRAAEKIVVDPAADETRTLNPVVL